LSLILVQNCISLAHKKEFLNQKHKEVMADPTDRDALDEIEFPSGFEHLRDELKEGRKNLKDLSERIEIAKKREGPDLGLRPPGSIRANFSKSSATLIQEKKQEEKKQAGRLAPALDKANEGQRETLSAIVEQELGISKEQQEEGRLYRFDRDGINMDLKQDRFEEMRKDANEKQYSLTERFMQNYKSMGIEPGDEEGSGSDPKTENEKQPEPGLEPDED
jgi:hypothetical protein